MMMRTIYAAVIIVEVTMKKVNEDNVGSEDEDEDEMSSDCESCASDADEEDDSVAEHEEDDLRTSSDDEIVGTKSVTDSAKKRKYRDFNGKLVTCDTSLRALKKLTGTTMGHHALPESTDGILSNEDFQKIKEKKAEQDATRTLAQHGLAKSAAIKKKLSKEERLTLVIAGREDRGKYQSRTAIKQKKTGGLSNRQKERRKKMPVVAKRVKVARSQVQRKRMQHGSRKEFRGRKAWKS